MNNSNRMPVRELLGVPVHAGTMQQVLERCGVAIEKRESLAIGVVNAAKIVNMRRDPLLKDSVLGSDLILADGMSIVWASRLLGQPLPERVPGIDLFENLLKLADDRGFRVYFLGAAQDVLAKMIYRVRAQHRNLIVAGSRDGYFDEAQSEQVAEEIRGSRADMLFVAMTSPKKEVFLGRWGRSLGVPVCHGVGGSFDVFAGKTRRAPQVWQRCGMEWLYRVIQEPRRMWKRYTVTNALFLTMLLRDCLWKRNKPTWT